MESSLKKTAVLDTSLVDGMIDSLNQDLAGLKVLAVEDSADTRQLFEIYLTGAGATVALAKDGNQGVQRALSEEFDVALMDIKMPFIDGNFAMAMLRKNGYKRPVIALTGHAMSEERANSMLNGFTDYIANPIGHCTLVRGLRKLRIKSK